MQRPASSLTPGVLPMPSKSIAVNIADDIPTSAAHITIHEKTQTLDRIQATCSNVVIPFKNTIAQGTSKISVKKISCGYMCWNTFWSLSDTELKLMMGANVWAVLVSRRYFYISINDTLTSWTILVIFRELDEYLDSKVHWGQYGPIWGRQGPGGPHVGPWTLLSGYPRFSKPTLFSYNICS